MSHYSKLILFTFLVCIRLHAQHAAFRDSEIIIQLKESVTMKEVFTTLPSFYNNEALIQSWRYLNLDMNIVLLKTNSINFLKAEQLLRTNPDIIFVQRNHIITPRYIPDDPLFIKQWHHKNDGKLIGLKDADLKSTKAWDLADGDLTELGDTIVICIIDDGVDVDHEDLKNVFWKNTREIPANGIDDDRNGYVDDYNGWNTFQRNDTFDIGDHGTQVCGLAAAESDNQLGITGIALNTKLMFVQGGSDEANAIESYSYPLTMRKLYNKSKGKQGAFVVATNSSWGVDYATMQDAPIWCAFYDSLGTAGILNIGSTANQNINVDVEGDLPTSCTSDYLLTVSNINAYNTKDFFAAFGREAIDIGVYGNDVMTTAPFDNYELFSGTSASAPLACGVVSFLYSVPCNNLIYLAKNNPALAALEVKNSILHFSENNINLTGLNKTSAVLNMYRSAYNQNPFISVATSKFSTKLSPVGNLVKFPVIIQWRKKGDANWLQKSATKSEDIVFSNLEKCTEYEYRISNGCERFTNAFSEIFSFKSPSCCELPQDIKYSNEQDGSISLLLSTNAKENRYGIILQKIGSNVIDTFYADVIDHTISLSHLEYCSEYRLKLFGLCTTDQLNYTQEYKTIITAHCDQCSSVDYCRRPILSSELFWIESVTIDNKTNKSYNDNGFGYFIGTDKTWIFNPNQKSEITITPNFKSSMPIHIAAWIDYNHDGAFEDAEKIAGLVNKTSLTVTSNFQIPTDAMSGYTRMRVMIFLDTLFDEVIDPCFSDIALGELEDYCVYINDNKCIPISNLSYSRPVPYIIQWSWSGAKEIEYKWHQKYSLDWIIKTSSKSPLVFDNIELCKYYELYAKPSCIASDDYHYRQIYTLDPSCVVTLDQTNPIKFNIFPNPNHGEFVLEFENSYLRVELFNAVNQLVYTDFITSLNQQHFRLKYKLTAGTYIIRLIDLKGFSSYRKLIIQ